jgi:hypothetical protein
VVKNKRRSQESGARIQEAHSEKYTEADCLLLKEFFRVLRVFRGQVLLTPGFWLPAPVLELLELLFLLLAENAGS